MSIILIAENDTCFCDCGTKCVLNKSGSQLRCTKKELEDNGYKTIILKGHINLWDLKSKSLIVYSENWFKKLFNLI